MSPIIEKLMRKRVVTDAGCWEWVGRRTAKGYGVLSVPTSDRVRDRKVHRLAYEAVRGPIPSGLVIDHLCRNRACFNPDHMEPVTSVENVMRGDTFSAANAAKTHCIRGHEFTHTGTERGRRRRYCRTCAAARRASVS